jgi:hypothetical protein
MLLRRLDGVALLARKEVQMKSMRRMGLKYEGFWGGLAGWFVGGDVICIHLKWVIHHLD